VFAPIVVDLEGETNLDTTGEGWERVLGEDRIGVEMDMLVGREGGGFGVSGEVRVGETVEEEEGRAESFWSARSESRMFQQSKRRRSVSKTRRGVSRIGTRATRCPAANL